VLRANNNDNKLITDALTSEVKRNTKLSTQGKRGKAHVVRATLGFLSNVIGRKEVFTVNMSRDLLLKQSRSQSTRSNTRAR